MRRRAGRRAGVGAPAVLAGPVRKIVTLEARQAKWLAHEAKRLNVSEAEVVRQIISNIMDK